MKLITLLTLSIVLTGCARPDLLRPTAASVTDSSAVPQLDVEKVIILAKEAVRRERRDLTRWWILKASYWKEEHVWAVYFDTDEGGFGRDFGLWVDDRTGDCKFMPLP
jgi:hypothetical protein